MEEERALKEKARQAAEVSRRHKKRIQEPETLRLRKAKDPNRPAKKPRKTWTDSLVSACLQPRNSRL